ncbi:MFS transporter [Actinokineospora fastidiosa]|uniref:MFS transporter n=1 Tax=Actinokineospora fastidiosa TaxID=1816 RepID=A0A918LG20_9PSEU|nr:MFS transporter [Actinokineospora fastidiosa]GGS42363.1 MFS transporter [Actinokineospora fastidiosa]
MVAVLVFFALNGVVFGSWASRVPALAAQIGAQEGALGLSLLGASVGMIAAASVTGRLTASFGARRVLGLSTLASAAALPLLGLAPSPLALGLALVLLGACVGTFDVAMNVAAVTVIRATERPMMPIFHASFSFGGLLGASGAAVAAFAGLPPFQHLLIVSGLVVVALAVFVRQVSDEVRPAEAVTTSTGPAAFRRPVLWLLAGVALFSAVAEGASADWSALFAAEYRGMSEASAAIVYGVFSIAMAVTRLFGERAQRRFGPERLLVFGALVGGGGLILTALAPSAVVTFAGFALAGVGLAYMFPVALDLAAAAGRRADGTGGERELGFVTTIAYSGFLAGPPLVGGIAHLSDLAVALGVAGMIACAIAPTAIAARAAAKREAVTV